MSADQKANNPFSRVEGDRDLALLGWFNHHPTSGAALPSSPELDAFVGTCWPMSSQYYSPMNAIWLMQIPDVRILAKRPYWLIRDGAVPLTWFFFRHPLPPQADTCLFIDEELIHLVPSAWNFHVGSYRLHSDAPQTADARAALVGLASESYASLKFVRERARSIAEKESFAKNFDLYLPTRWSPAQDEERETYHAHYFREVFAAFPDRSRILTRTEFTGTFDFQNVRVWDLNEKLMIADNSIVQFALKKGAQWPLSRAISGNEKYMKLSNFHGYVFNSEPIAADGDSVQSSLKSAQRFHAKIEDVHRTNAFREFPWPSWFAEWIQASSATPQSLAKPRDKPAVSKKKKSSSSNSKKRK